MNTYGITALNGDKTQAVGNSPKEAFESVFPGVELIPCEPSSANICIQLLDGERQSTNFYIAGESSISKQNLDAYHINNPVVIKFLNMYPDKIDLYSNFENKHNFPNYERSGIGASYKAWGNLCKLIREKEKLAKERSMNINKAQLYDRCARTILCSNVDVANYFSSFVRSEFSKR